MVYGIDITKTSYASASSFATTGYEADKAFDNIPGVGGGNRWAAAGTFNPANPEWLKQDFGAGNEKTIAQYTIVSDINILKDWLFQGSNDDTNWDTLDSQTDQYPDTYTVYTFSNTTAYRYYRMWITAINIGQVRPSIGEMEMMEGYDEILDQSVTQSGTDYEYFIHSSRGKYIYQSFVPTVNSLFKRFRLKFNTASHPDKLLTGYLYNDNGGVPGTLLATLSSIDASIIENYITDIDFSFIPDLNYTEDLCNGGTAIASSYYVGHPATHAFDDNSATFWHSDVSGLPQWIGYDFGEGITKVIRRITLKMDYSGGNNYCKDFKFQGSNNGSDYTDIYTGQTTNDGNVQTFNFANSVAYRYYRIYITTSWSYDYGSLAEVEMMEKISLIYNPDFLTGGTASAEYTETAASLAVNNNISDYWYPGALSYSTWWKYDLGVGVTKIARKLTMLSSYSSTYIPKTFILAGSNDNSNWTDITTINTAQSTSKQTFYFDNSVAYRYYRVMISADWGAGTLVVNEFELMEASNPYPIVAGTKYHMVVGYPEINDTNYTAFAINTNGSLYPDNNNGYGEIDSWTPQGYDIAFEEFYAIEAGSVKKEIDSDAKIKVLDNQKTIDSDTKIIKRYQKTIDSDTKIIISIEKIELDYMEYATNTLARENYISDEESGGEEVITYYDTGNDISGILGAARDDQYDNAQIFTLDSEVTISLIEELFNANLGFPVGNITCRIETVSVGKPSGILAHANLTKVFTPVPSSWNTITFDIPATITAGTYAIVMIPQNQVANNGWNVAIDATSPTYSGGYYCYRANDGTWNAYTPYDIMFRVKGTSLVDIFEIFSESTIKTQGSYSLKIIAPITTSLNKSVTHIIVSPVDLSGQNTIKYDQRALRPGSNIKIEFHNATGMGYTIEHTHNQSADEFETAIIDISGIIDENKNAIDEIKVTIINADSENTFYLDNIYATPTPTKNISSDARIKVIGGQKTIDSDAKVVFQYQEEINSDAYIHSRVQKEILSNSKIFVIGGQKTIDSDAKIVIRVNLITETNLITRKIQDKVIKTILNVINGTRNIFNTNLTIKLETKNITYTDLRTRNIDYDNIQPKGLNNIIINKAELTNFLTGGIASADNEFPGYSASRACDGLLTEEDGWYTEDLPFPHWWKYDLGAEVTQKAHKLKILSASGGQLKNFKLQGSNNNSTWTDLYTGIHSTPSAWEEYNFVNNISYRYYRLYITSNWRADDYSGIVEIELS